MRNQVRANAREKSTAETEREIRTFHPNQIRIQRVRSFFDSGVDWSDLQHGN